MWGWGNCMAGKVEGRIHGWIDLMDVTKLEKRKKKLHDYLRVNEATTPRKEEKSMGNEGKEHLHT